MFYVPGGNASSTKGEGGEAGKAAKAAKGSTTGFQSDAAKKAADKKAKKGKADAASAKKEAKKKAKGGKTDADAKDDKTRGGLDGPTEPFRGGGAGEAEDAAPPKVKKPKTAWAEFIAKDGDGNPLGGLDFELTDIAGDKHKGKTAPNGSGRVEKIPEGLVKVKFPALLSQVPGFTMELKEAPKKKASEAKAPAPAPKKPAEPEPPKKKEPEKPLVFKNAPPPRGGSDWKHDDTRETEWFPKLAKTTFDDLKPGDILIRKVFTPHVMRSMQHDFQMYFKNGSPMTIECGVHLGGGEVARMSAIDDKAITAKPTAGDWMAFRPMDPKLAEAGLEAVKFLLSKGISYSILHLLDGGVLGGISGAKGPDAEKMAKKTLPYTKMHEGEWMAFVFQAQTPTIWKVPATVMSPGRIEQLLNDDIYKRFTFIGAISLGDDTPAKESEWRHKIREQGRAAKHVKWQYENPHGTYMGLGEFANAYLRIWPKKDSKD